MSKIFNTRNIIAVLGIILIIFYTLIQISGIKNTDTVDLNINDTGNSGFYIFYNLLTNLKYNTTIWHFIREPQTKACFIFLDYDYEKINNLNNILDYVKNGSSLFLIGINTSEDPVFKNEIVNSFPIYEKIIIDDKYNYDIPNINIKINRNILTAANHNVLLSNSEGSVLIKETYGEGYVYLLPDRGLFSNVSMTDSDVSILVNNIFKEYYDHELIFFENESDILKEINPIMVLFKGNLFYITMHLILIFVFFIFYKGIRFGSPVKVDTLVRRSITNHLNAVGQFYLRIKANELVDELNINFFTFKLYNMFRIKKHISLDELYIYMIKRIDVEKEHFINITTVKENIKNQELLKREQFRKKILTRLKIKEK